MEVRKVRAVAQHNWGRAFMMHVVRSGRCYGASASIGRHEKQPEAPPLKAVGLMMSALKPPKEFIGLAEAIKLENDVTRAWGMKQKRSNNV